ARAGDDTRAHRQARIARRKRIRLSTARRAAQSVRGARHPEARVSTASAPALLVIFGATGDLSRRKLLPALGALHTRRALPSRLVVLGVARDPHPDDAAFRDIARAALQGLPDDRI